MGRGYTADDYRRLIAHVRARIPDASIATDVIVGFPRERHRRLTLEST